MDKEKTFTLYMHTNKINNKKYIGITGLKPKTRWMKDGKGYKTQQLFWRAIQKYGWDNFEHIIIFEGLSEDEAKNLEIKYIEQYKTTDVNYGYNRSAGGDMSSTGLYNNESTSTKVYQYDLNGNFIKEWDSIREVERQLGIFNTYVCFCCKGKRKYAGGFQWRYEQVEKIEEIDLKEFRKSYAAKKPVSQYKLDGEFITTYKSAREAERATGIGYKMISRVCNGERPHTHGYVWKFAS